MPKEALGDPSRTGRPPGYRVVAVSLFDLEVEIAERLSNMLKAAGWPRANRSFIVREALLRLYEDVAGLPAAEVPKYFVERQARRLARGPRV
jgi:hypothetical protein